MTPIELAIVTLLAGGTTLLTALFLLLGRRGRDPYEFLVESYLNPFPDEV